MESKLALRNESVQIQVCSDYNFHSEELFKVNYWTRVILTLSSCDYRNNFGAISPSSLKHWWVKQVSPRTLPGLRKILLAAVKNQSGELVLFSNLRCRYSGHFNIPTSPRSPRQPTQSLVGRLATSLWRIAVGGDNSDGEDSPTSGSLSLDESEIILSIELLKKISGKILSNLQKKSDSPLASILVTETDVTRALGELVESHEPFVSLSLQAMTVVVVTCLVDMWKAIPFTINSINCLKLPLLDTSDDPEPVSDRDKAYLISEIASEKLMTQETLLTDQWTAVNDKLKDHLKAGRKPLALAALKERKMIEQRIEEIQIYKLKLTESTSVSQTAVIQQAVVEAISIGNKAARTTLQSSVEDVEDIMEQADELRNEVKQISEAITGTETDIDDAVLLEYEELLKERDEEISHTEALIDMIPSPPTDQPETLTKISSPPVRTAELQSIVPEEWFSDIQ